MTSDTRARFLAELGKRFGSVTKMPHSLSLFIIGGGIARLYVRYSKVHGKGQTFYGLRAEDLLQLSGFASVICFLWEGQKEPLMVRYSDYEAVFQSVSPASDGQYKAQVYFDGQGTELYVAHAGRFAVEGSFGWHVLEDLAASASKVDIPDLSHSQVQTLLGRIGVATGYEVWIPSYDRVKLDHEQFGSFTCCDTLPCAYESVQYVLQEVDVVWVKPGAGIPSALFEVEHSTPVYSGLLRFNDVHLVLPAIRPRFHIVAHDARRDLFVRHVRRPTFNASGLSDLCSFLDYRDVFAWFSRVSSAPSVGGQS